MTIHKQREVLRQRGIAAHHAMAAQRPNVALLHEGLQLIRVDVAVIVLHVLVMDFGEQVVYLRSVKAGRAKVITGKLQVGQQIRQRFRLPFADRFVERDVQGFLVLRVFNMNHHAVDFLYALRDQHLIPLVAAHDVAGDLIPDHGIDIAVGGHAAFDLLIGRIARLQVFARIVFRRFQLFDRHLLQLHISIHVFSFNGIISLIVSRIIREISLNRLTFLLFYGII